MSPLARLSFARAEPNLLLVGQHLPGEGSEPGNLLRCQGLSNPGNVPDGASETP